MMTFAEMAQYLSHLAAKQGNDDDKVNLAIISGVLSMLSEKMDKENELTPEEKADKEEMEFWDADPLG